MSTWLTCLEKWQTLVSGILALLAALGGAYMIHRQIRQQQKIENNRISRQYTAARSTLPLVLSSIMEYTRGVGGELRRIYTEEAGDHVRSEVFSRWQIPPFPQGDAGTLASIIEGAPEDIVVAISKLLTNLQVQATNTRGLEAGGVLGTTRRRTVPKPEIETYIKRTADIYARCSMLLEYARDEIECVDPAPDVEHFSRALFIFGFLGEVRERLVDNLFPYEPEPKSSNVTWSQRAINWLRRRRGVAR